MATAEALGGQHEGENEQTPGGLNPASGEPRLSVTDMLAALGDWSLFALSTLLWCVRRRPAPGTLTRSIYFVGVKTAPVVIVTGAFIGMVLRLGAT